MLQGEESQGILEYMRKEPPIQRRSSKNFSRKAIQNMSRVYWSCEQSISFKVSKYLEKQNKELLYYHGIETNGYNQSLLNFDDIIMSQPIQQFFRDEIFSLEIEQWDSIFEIRSDIHISSPRSPSLKYATLPDQIVCLRGRKLTIQKHFSMVSVFKNPSNRIYVGVCG